VITGEITQKPSGIAVAADGGILVTVVSPAGLIRVDPHAGTQRQLATGQPLDLPSRVAPEADGNAVVTDVGLRGIVRVELGGVQTRLSTAGLPQTPVGIAVVPVV
jgi:streptogramin lyase